MTQLARTSRSAARTASLALAALGTAAGLIGGFMAPVAAADDAAQPTYDNYVALGDSYASGAGGSPVIDADCDRTGQSYPSVIAAAVKAKSFKNVTCSGATTAEMAKAQGTNPAQLSALSADTDLVTLTIGGNDIGFTDIITNCVVGSFSDPTGSPCKKHYNESGSDAIDTRINSTASKLTVSLAYIRALAPKARVVVVGYPSLVPDDGKVCRPGVPFADGDVSYLRDVDKKLNQALADRARSAGVEYADTYTMTIGHDMCQGEADRWIEPIETKLAPAHPNSWGQHAMAYGVYDQLLLK
ncbi:SGNH/GDSL hydrolase family protein [Streptomyces sp. NPDC058221]|uniref:SGNH/GDSL hydrolase family protein n=1 Tax=Streptomyces sp. NPDC058221 TaxID=3346388 RepID=UPI0036E2D447